MGFEVFWGRGLEMVRLNVFGRNNLVMCGFFGFNVVRFCGFFEPRRLEPQKHFSVFDNGLILTKIFLSL